MYRFWFGVLVFGILLGVGGPARAEWATLEGVTLEYGLPGEEHVTVTGNVVGGLFVDVEIRGEAPDGTYRGGECPGRDGSACGWALSEAFWTAYPTSDGPDSVILEGAGAVLLCRRDEVGGLPGVVHGCTVYREDGGTWWPLEGGECAGILGVDLAVCVGAAF